MCEWMFLCVFMYSQTCGHTVHYWWVNTCVLIQSIDLISLYKACSTQIREGHTKAGQRQHLLQLLGDSHEAEHLLQMCREPRSSPYMDFGWWFSLCEPPWVQVSWLYRSSRGVLVLSTFLNPFPKDNFSTSLPQPLPQFGLMFCLNLFICFHQLLDKAS